MNHYLKTIEPFFSLQRKRIKTFELRKYDNNFKENDIIFSFKWDFSERKLALKKVTGGFAYYYNRADIRYIKMNFAGLQKGYCILQLGKIEPGVFFDYSVHTEIDEIKMFCGP